MVEAVLLHRKTARKSRAPAGGSPTEPQHKAATVLTRFYRALFKQFGPQHWWPGETPFEIVIGAILTQNTAWTNVEKAIHNLKRAGALSVAAMEALPQKELAVLIRPSGYYNQKAKKLRAFLQYLRENHGGSLDRMFGLPTKQLRRELLGINGIGAETADSILLYGGGHSIFVVDAYTRRVLLRHGLLATGASYHDIQQLFHAKVTPDARVYNEFHALLVETGKRHCLKSKPQCEGCPLDRFPHQVEA